MPVKQWLPGWMGGARRRASAATCVYLSGSAVASVTGQRVSTDAEDRFEVSVRADPITATDQIGAALSQQVRSLSLKNNNCHVVLAPEFYNLSLVERPPVARMSYSKRCAGRFKTASTFPWSRRL